MFFIQQWLVVKQVELGRGAALEEKDDTFCRGTMMERCRDSLIRIKSNAARPPRPSPKFWSTCRRHTEVE